MSVDIERTTIYEQTTPAFDPKIFGAELAAEMPQTTTTIVAGDDGFVHVRQGVHGDKSPEIALFPDMIEAIVEWAKTREENDHSMFVTTMKLGTGWAAVAMWWAPEHGGFWEPWDTGFGRHCTQDEAVTEAKEWAKADGLRYKASKPE